VDAAIIKIQVFIHEGGSPKRENRPQLIFGIVCESPKRENRPWLIFGMVKTVLGSFSVLFANNPRE
jgi:hypothetical protein